MVLILFEALKPKKKKKKFHVNAPSFCPYKVDLSGHIIHLMTYISASLFSPLPQHPNSSLLCECAEVPYEVTLLGFCFISARSRSQDQLRNGFKKKKRKKKAATKVPIALIGTIRKGARHFRGCQRIYFNNKMERWPARITAWALIYAAE